MATSKSKTKKDESFWKVLSAAVELDYRKGHLRWTMTELSRRSGVTRSLIYYYFGRSKLNIVKSAVKIVGDEIIGLSERRLQMWRDGEYLNSLRESRAILEKAPFIGAFYLTCRAWENELGQTVRTMEKLLLKKIKNFIPTFNDEDARALATIYFGLVFSPFSGHEVIEQVFPNLFKAMEAKAGVSLAPKEASFSAKKSLLNLVSAPAADFGAGSAKGPN